MKLRLTTIFLIITLLSVPAFSTTINVPADQSSIQAGIDASVSGDTVLVAPGTYIEALIFPKYQLVVKSSGEPNETFIDYAGAGNLITAIDTDSGSVLDGFSFIDINCSNIIYTYNATYLEIRNNRIINCTYSVAIRGRSNSSLIIKNNLFVNPYSSGITVFTEGRNCEFINNTIDGGHRGLAMYGNDNLILNNIITNLRYYGTWDLKSSTVIDYNDFWNNSPDYGGNASVGINDISLDPLYNTPSIFDYTLQPTSPCIDAGDPDPIYNDENGTRNDMGAFPGSVNLPIPSNLTIENEARLNVINHTPSFSWNFYDTVGSQYSYEIEVSTDNDWTTADYWASGEVISTDEFAVYGGSPLVDGEFYYYRVRLNNGIDWGDWIEKNFRMNSIPTTPTLLSPINQKIRQYQDIELFANNSIDSEADPITYDFEVYSDIGLVVLIEEFTGIAEVVDSIGSGVLTNLEPDIEYWWRVRTFDGFEYSDWSTVESFITRQSGIINVPADETTIQTAIDIAAHNDTVFVAPGEYFENLVITDQQFVLLSSGGADVTFISSLTDDQMVVNFEHNYYNISIIDGFTIQNSNGSASGIYIGDNNSPQIKNCILNNNKPTSAAGGGIYCRGNDVSISNCSFINNSTSSRGGGIFLDNCQNINIDSCLFTLNSSGDGGGAISVYYSINININYNLIYSNFTTDDYGGVVYIENSEDVNIINNTIALNNSGSNGSGITINYGNYIDIRNNIIVSNYGGIAVYSRSSSSIITSEYNDVYQNLGGDYYFVTPGIGSISSDPSFIDINQKDFSLAINSPCIDAGDPDPIYNDIYGTRNDMGAATIKGDMPLPLGLQLLNESQQNVINHIPTIVWKYYDQNGSQYSYEIEVGSDNDWTSAEMWATGEVITSDFTAVYDGTALVDATKYYYRVRVNNGTNWGDWFPLTFTMNSIPTIPVLNSPVNQEVIHYLNVSLNVNNSTDAESDSKWYDFEVYSDVSLTTLVTSVNDIPEIFSITNSGVIAGLEQDVEYWWRSRAFDGYEYTGWSNGSSFITRGNGVINVPSDQPTIQAGIDFAYHGDTILVAPGTYVETIDLNKSLFLISADGAENTIWQPETPTDRTLTVNNSLANNSQISGFTFNVGEYYSFIYINNVTMTISNNIFTGFTGQYYYTVRCSGDVVVKYNLFINNAGNACIHNNGTALIHNNTFDNNYRAIYGTSIETIYNNLITNSSNYGILGNINNIDYNNLWNNTTDYGGGAVAGANDISVDPLYIDPANNNYNLLSNSPCIDAGNPDPIYFDPDGTINDMGAFPVFRELPIASNLMILGEGQLNIINHNPIFSWIFFDNVGSPSTYELEVGTDAEWSTAEMWATGEVVSSDTSVVYAGLELLDGVIYYYRLRLNNGTKWGSWLEYNFRMNTTPEIPIIIKPKDQQPVRYNNLQLYTNNSVDSDADPLVYDFEVYSDLSLTILITETLDIAEQTDSTSSGVLPDFDLDQEYWWRVRSFDGYEFSGWSAVSSFITKGNIIINVPGDASTIEDGVALAFDGDTVLVAPGTYSENISIYDKSVVIISKEGPSNTIIIPYPYNQPAIFINTEVASGCVIDGFTFQGGSGYGVVRINNNAAPTIKNNIFMGYSGSRVALYCSYSDPLIKNNLFYENGGISCIGIYSGTARIINNTFDNNARGFLTLNNSGIAYNNIVTNSSAYGVYGYFAEFDYNNIWNNNGDYSGGASAGPNDLSVDPLYVDAANFDYSLSSLSPSIDAGNPDVAYNDADGTRNDMGAFPDLKLSPFSYNLQILDETQTNIINHTPVFSWLYFDIDGSQYSYEIEIGIDLDWTTAELWSTGVVISSDTFAVYSGNELLDGQIYYIRIRLDNGSESGDWLESSFHMNSKPTVPVLNLPINQLSLVALSVNLNVYNATDDEDVKLYYEFEIYEQEDENLQSIFTTIYDIEEQPDSTFSGYIEGLSSDVEYWWRARTFDGYEFSQWSPSSSFITHSSSSVRVPEDYPTIQAAIDFVDSYDSVIVAPGYYFENLNFNGKIIILTSSHGPLNTTLTNADITKPLIEFVTGENAITEFSGFTVSGSGYIYLINIIGSSPTIKNNIFRDYPHSYGIIQLENSSSLIKRNLFHDNRGKSINIISGATKVYNNSFYYNFRSIYSSSESSDVINNIITASISRGVGGTFGRLDYNNIWHNVIDYDDGATAGLNDISSDPLYLYQYTNDFRLTVNSPCVDGGHPDEQYNDEDGSQNDMGAYPLDYQTPLPVNLSMPDEMKYEVLNHTPEFSWIFYDVSGNQYSYQMEVGIDNDWTLAEMWNPGEVISTDTSVVYNGSPLEDGKGYYYRLRLNNGTNWGDWAEDYFKMNTTPSIPVLIWPLDKSEVEFYDVNLFIRNSTYELLDTVTYDFEIYSDEELTWLIKAFYNIEEQIDSTTPGIITDIDYGKEFWWRSRAYDGYEYTEWSGLKSFTTSIPNIIRVPEDHPSIQQAIIAAEESDIIEVGPNTYNENLSFLGKSILLISREGAKNTILQAANQELPHIIIKDIFVSRSELRGFTITDGWMTNSIEIDNADVLIKDNIFHDNIPETNTHIAVISCTNTASVITRNIFYNNGGMGCIETYDNTSNVKIINNTFDKNYRGIYIYQTGCFILNNNITNTQEFGVRIISGSYNQFDYNNVWNNTPNYTGTYPGGEHDISENPLYSDNSSANFYIDENSPCIDAGHPDAIYFDINGSRNDIGAIPGQLYAPTTPIKIFPLNEFVYSVNPNFTWNTSTDADGDLNLLYNLTLSLDQDFTFTTSIDSIADTTVVFTNHLEANTIYWWKIAAQDSFGKLSKSYGAFFKIWLPGDIDHSGNLDIDDLVYLVNFVFKGGPSITPIHIGDFTGDCVVDIDDLIYIVSFVFNNGPDIQIPCQN